MFDKRPNSVGIVPPMDGPETVISSAESNGRTMNLKYAQEKDMALQLVRCT